MKSERETTRIVQSWLEVGSTGLPDRVLDAVVAELPSRPQRRSRWSPRRTSTMKLLLPIAAAAAAIAVVAVVLGGRFLPSEPSVGGPTDSSAPSATARPVGGQYTFAGDISVDMDAASDGSALSGTAVGSTSGEPFTIDFQCLRQFDDQTWMLAGVLTQSAVPAQPDGSWAAVIVRDGSPQQTGIYIQPQATADDCAEFVREIPDNAVEGFEMIGPMDSGSVVLPPAPAPTPDTSTEP
jgi:hypothetical protein